MCSLKDELCIGCGRTVEQITLWSTYTNKQKQKVVEGLDARKGE